MYIPRAITDLTKMLRQKMPVLCFLGPRQSGKTTFTQVEFPDHQYFTLESLDTREYATEDPRGFLSSIIDGNPDGVILDEIQKVPHLLSYIQEIVDKQKQPGYFVLTGSQNLLLLEQVSQSLAGRVALLNLLPFSEHEIHDTSYTTNNLNQAIFQGSYPRVLVDKLEPNYWYLDYIKTYIERDVRLIKNITDLGHFHLFLKLCAGRTGQILSLTELSNDAGIAANTVKSWLSILEACYIIYLIPPYMKSFNKRLIKSPKLYFYDTGIACALLGITSPDQVSNHYLKGGLFESFVFSEMKKRIAHYALNQELYFWRDNKGVEVDCLFERKNKLYAIEMKSGRTINSDWFKTINQWQMSINIPDDEINKYLIYGGDQHQTRNGVKVLPWWENPILP